MVGLKKISFGSTQGSREKGTLAKKGDTVIGWTFDKGVSKAGRDYSYYYLVRKSATSGVRYREKTTKEKIIGRGVSEKSKAILTAKPVRAPLSKERIEALNEGKRKYNAVKSSLVAVPNKKLIKEYINGRGRTISAKALDLLVRIMPAINSVYLHGLVHSVPKRDKIDIHHVQSHHETTMGMLVY